VGYRAPHEIAGEFFFRRRWLFSPLFLAFMSGGETWRFARGNRSAPP